MIWNSKISCISTISKKEISILSHIAKKLQAYHYLQNCLLQSGMGKKHGFWAILKEKKFTILSINFSFIKLETQDSNVSSTTKTVL